MMTGFSFLSSRERREIARLFCAGIIICSRFLDEDKCNELIGTLLYLKNDNPRLPISIYFNVPGALMKPCLAVYDTRGNPRSPPPQKRGGHSFSFFSQEHTRSLRARGGALFRPTLPFPKLSLKRDLYLFLCAQHDAAAVSDFDGQPRRPTAVSKCAFFLKKVSWSRVSSLRFGHDQKSVVKT